MKKLMLLMILTVFFIECITTPDNKIYNLSFPFILGKVWEYDFVSQIDDSIISTYKMWTKVTQTQEYSVDFEYYVLQDSTADSLLFSFYYKMRDSIYVYSGPSIGLLKDKKLKEEGSSANAILVIPLQFKINDTWSNIISKDSGVVEKKTYTFKGIENIKTKAGSFDCYKIENKSSQDSQKEAYYYFC